MSLKSKIEQYTGTVSYNLYDFINGSIKHLYKLFPNDIKRRFAQRQVVDINGYDVSNAYVVFVAKNGYPSTEISPAEEGYYLDANSIYTALDTSPVHYIKDSKLYVIPAGGEAFICIPPTATEEDNVIKNFPEEYEESVVLRTAMKILINEMSSLENEQIDYTLPSQPIAPGEVSIDWSGLSLLLPSYQRATSVTFSNAPTLPTGIKPNSTLGTPPSTPSFSFSGTYPTKPTFVTLPSNLTASSVSDVALPVINNSLPLIDFSSIPNPPNITTTGLTLDLTSLADEMLDIENAVISYTEVVPNSVNATTNNLLDNITELNKAINLIDAEEDVELAQIKLAQISTAIAEQKANLDALLAEATTNAKLSDDVKVQNEVNKLTESIKKYERTVQIYTLKLNELKEILKSKVDEKRLSLELWSASVRGQVESLISEYTKKIEVHSIEVNDAVKILELNLQKAIDQARRTDEMAVKEIELIIQKNQQLLAQYQIDLEKYKQDLENAKITFLNSLEKWKADYEVWKSWFVQRELEIKEWQTEIGIWQQNIAVWEKDRITAMQNFVNEMQDNLNKFQEEVAIYNAKIEELKKDADLSAQQKLSIYQAQIQLWSSDIMGRVNLASAKIQEKASKLGIIQGKLESIKLLYEESIRGLYAR